MLYDLSYIIVNVFVDTDHLFRNWDVEIAKNVKNSVFLKIYTNVCKLQQCFVTFNEI